MTKKQEAKCILGLLGMPAKQQSDICAYSLLSLLRLTPATPWSSASNEWTRIHDVLTFLRTSYRGVKYAENSREPFRKEAMHHFRTAAIIEDDGTATNSPNYRYRVTPEALSLVHTRSSRIRSHGKRMCGSPCQPFSRRGKRKGKDDARDGFPAYIEESLHEVTSGEALADKLATIPDDAEFQTPSMDRYIAAYEKASHCSRPRDLRLDEPARTLTCRNLAGCTSDMHRIRLGDGRRRRLSVHEAARLQSFPDWYSFSGTQEQQFTQIGNAVPPLFAYRLAQSVVRYLKQKASEHLV